MNAQAQLKVVPSDDSAKRRQIVEGARQIFLQHGFDAASMNDIARKAGVSKGTLYVYFENKEQLFEAIVHEECQVHAERTFNLDSTDHDVDGVLTRLGFAFLEFLCRPEKASALRTVIAIADRMPEIGRVFYETGPALGIEKLAEYLRAQTEAGVLAVDACQSTVFKPVLFNFREAPGEERMTYVVGVAVKMFMAAYRAR
jgi:AcrR family transcriptional regulator